MNNYEYIIACLPVLGEKAALDRDAIMEGIRSQCSPADNALIDILADSFDPGKLDSAFYAGALSCRNSFLRQYLMWDLQVRNTKARYLNRALGRPEDTDTIDLPGALDYDGEESVQAVLSGPDILERERGLDSLMWDKAEKLVELHLFDIDVILSFIARLNIADRWNKLDPQRGRALFKRLVDEIRQTRQ